MHRHPVLDPSLQPAAQRAADLITQAGSLLIAVRINPREFAVPSTADVGLDCGALTGLRLIDEALGEWTA